MNVQAFKPSINSILLIQLALLLVSCGGGGGGSTADTPPTFTSGTTASIAENSISTGYTAVATNATSYSLAGGSDVSAFTIDASTGVLSFSTAPDYESPNDSDVDNTYIVDISATAGNATSTQTVTVTITDVFDLNVAATNVKSIKFNWTALNNATFYKLLVNPDGVSGYSSEQNNITILNHTVVLSVHFTDWVNASYILEAYDGTGLIDTTPAFNITPFMLSSIGYFKQSNTDTGSSGDGFGHSIALSDDGSTMAIGARGEGSAATGINGDQADNTALSSGAVYVFTHTNNIWSQQAYIKASNTEFSDYFGGSVALSADGSTLAIGAGGEDSAATGINGNEADNSVCQTLGEGGRCGDAGAVYVYTRTGTTWTKQAYIKASNTDPEDLFSVVSLSGDGNTLVVTTTAEQSSATGINGDQTSNSSISMLGCCAGAAYVFTRTADTWSQQAYIKASNTNGGDQFGTDSDLSFDGSTLAISARLEKSSAIGINGDETLNDSVDASGTGSGAVYIFTRNITTWSQQAYIKASNTDGGDTFGRSLSISNDGNTLAVGATGESSSATGINGDQNDNSASYAGAVYIFTRTGGTTWSQQAYLKASNTQSHDHFGNKIALSGDGGTLVASSGYESSSAVGVNGDQIDNSLDIAGNFSVGAGAAYVFTRSGTTWSQKTYVKAPNTEIEDKFGFRIGINNDGSVLAISSPGERSSATGINGDQLDNSSGSDVSFFYNAGAVFMY